MDGKEIDSCQDIQYHGKCYDTYTHSTTLARIKAADEAQNLPSNLTPEGDEDSQPSRRSSSRKKDRAGKSYLSNYYFVDFLF